MSSWYKSAVVYQIYPQSFKDTNGDGVGDIIGIVEKLDYLKNLGINAIWICPMYASPNKDNGYDVSDYYSLQTRYGSMADFETLVEQAHKRNIKIIMDLVLNHTSNENEWFVQSKSSKSNEKSDWYIWKDPKPNGAPPTNWGAMFGGSAWTYCKERNQYYFHSFSPYQPDLNWESPSMKKELFKMVAWWINKGVDGFRLDAINFISKNTNWPDGRVTKDNQFADIYKFAANGPKVHQYLQEFKREVLDKYDVLTVGEASSSTIKDALAFSNELDMIFQFEHVALDIHPTIPWGIKPINFEELKKVLSKWQIKLFNKSWNALFWENHDQPRSVTRFGFDNVNREKCAKLLAVSMYFLQGTPFVFQGQELGIVNTEFYSRNEIRDIEIKNAFARFVDSGEIAEQDMLARVSRRARDTSRTPMPWNDSANGGFSSAEPWIKVNQCYKKINVAEQLTRCDSVLNFYKKLFELRKNLTVVTTGKYKQIGVGNKNVFAYKRFDNSNCGVAVICNFSNKECHCKINLHCDSKVLLNNDPANDFSKTKMLSPYQAVVIRL